MGDLWLPSGATRAVVVHLHGGYFRARYGRDLGDALAADLAARGFAVWNVEYRRTGSGGGPAVTVGDVRAAVDHLGDLGEVAGLPVAAIGHSAGGYLACALAPHPAVTLVVGMAPVLDCAAIVRGGWDRGGVSDWIGAGPDEVPGRYAATDLRRSLPTGTPQVVVHGADDDVVPVAHSRAYVAAVSAAGDDAELHELPGVGHFAFLDPATPATEVVVDALLRWS